MRVKLAAMSLMVMSLTSVLATSQAHAVPNPGGIDWTGSPAAFVTSLYTSVLGRAPESSAVVAGWAAQITASPASRRNVFWGFVSSPEYQASLWARQPREYAIYIRIEGDWNLYVVSKGPLPAEYRLYEGRYTFGVAMALRQYYATYTSRR
jgi:hypothetical protein